MKIDRQIKTDREVYYADGASWANDVQGSLRRSRKTAWVIAAGAGAIALFEAIALISLVPLKTVVPYTILVDRQTGYIETAPGLKPGALSQDVAVTHAFLAQYVMARETYDVADLQANYRKITAWSAGEARSAYVRTMAPNNPQSPTQIYQPTTVVQVVIKGVSLLSANSALVRFDAVRYDGGGAGDSRPYSAVVSFRYTGAPMQMQDRYLNPLGFQVTAYRRDAETIGVMPVAAP